MMLVQGGIGVVFGLLIVTHPGISASVVTWLAGLFFVVRGLLEALAAFGTSPQGLPAGERRHRHRARCPLHGQPRRQRQGHHRRARHRGAGLGHRPGRDRASRGASSPRRRSRPPRELRRTWARWLAAVIIAGEIVLRIAALGFIPRNRKPTTGMAWLLVILFDPWIGFFFFLFFGSARVGRKRRAKQAEINRLISERTAEPPRPTRVRRRPLVTTFLHLNRSARRPAAGEAQRRWSCSPTTSTSIAAMTAAVKTRPDPGARRVLHLRPRRHDPRLLRRARRRGRARGEGAVPLRPPRVAQAARATRPCSSTAPRTAWSGTG